MNGIQPTKLNAARKGIIAKEYRERGPDAALKLAERTGIESLALAVLLADLRDEAPTDDDRGDELAIRERDDRFAQT